MNLVKQMLTEVYRVPAVLPREDNLAEIARYLLKDCLVPGADADIQEMVAKGDGCKGIGSPGELSSIKHGGVSFKNYFWFWDFFSSFFLLNHHTWSLLLIPL